jgi:hypothetical protein
MNPFENINVISLEISNVCPHARLHPLCPRSVLTDPPTWLPLDIIAQVFQEMGEYGYKGHVMLSLYNEPLADPRLFIIMEYLRVLAPEANLQIWTSSYLLTDGLIEGLAYYGLAFLGVNHYGPEEQKRTFTTPAGLQMERRGGEHDSRKKLYGMSPEFGGLPWCSLPRWEIVIHHTGEVGLCCFDWARDVVFGDLHKETLASIIMGEARRQVIEESLRDGRCLDICQRCPHQVQGRSL